MENKGSQEKKVSKVEIIKHQSQHLRGSIEQELSQDTSRFNDDTVQVLKFHGMYQQDDRDLRKQLKKEGKERAYSMMIRARIPGGVMTPEQYLQFDKMADLYGNHTMRVTTRQTFQLHGILKSNIKETLRSINEVLITTLGGCGDQVRNTVGCAEPHEGPFYEAVRADMLTLVDRFSAKTHAYHEIWLDGEKVDLNDAAEEEPLYGEVYLPRKFKIAFAYDGDNCMDVYSNDLGIVAHRNGDEVEGYTLLVGGGMGRTAAVKETYPRLASPLADVTREELVEVCTAIVKVQRDHGNRQDRRFARMKYLIDKMGLDWFKSQVERYAGHSLNPPRDLKWESAADHLGWHEQEDGHGYLGIYVQNGRLHDTEQMQLKTVLKEIISTYRPTVRLTTQQNVLLADLTKADRVEIEGKLRTAGVPLADQLSPAKLNAMACPALPTCGLATTESERILPDVLSRMEHLLHELGLEQEPIGLRMTGCPNGCARPYIAEIGFVGRAPGKYDLFLGADPLGARTNELYKELVSIDRFEETLRPILEAFSEERSTGESFGDFCDRVGFSYLQKKEAAYLANV